MEQDFLPLNGTDFIEFYVGNAKQAAIFYQATFGFELRAYAGPETGLRDRVSYMVQQGNIRLVLTGALQQDSPIAAHVQKHGDGVKVLGLMVDDAREAYNQAVKRGAEPVAEPQVIEDEHGTVTISSIQIYGETVHTFVERKNHKGPFLPGYVPK